jgi:hypothetical protein
VNSKNKFLKEIKIVTPVNAQMIRKRNCLTVHVEKVLVVWREDFSYVYLNQNLIENKALSSILQTLREVR